MNKATGKKTLVLGLDPGTRITGYGLIEAEGDRQAVYRAHGLIRPPQGRAVSFQRRLRFIYEELEKIYLAYKPQETAVEKVFLGKNPESAFKLGHAAALCLLQSERHNSAFFEYASRLVKKTVTFSGRAAKEMTRRFTANALRIPCDLHEIPLDAADALAVALCHIRHKKSAAGFARLEAQRTAKLKLQTGASL